MQCDIPPLNIICHMMLGHQKALLSDGHGGPILAPEVLDVSIRSEGSWDCSLQRHKSLRCFACCRARTWKTRRIVSKRMGRSWR